MTHRNIIASAILGAGLLGLAHSGAEAAIQCDGNFQNVRGQPVATLYCREWNLAQVARSFGWRHVTAQSIRYSESVKAQVCRAVGFDTRVQEICAPFTSNGGSNRFTN
jgi:hypothetical protein